MKRVIAHVHESKESLINLVWQTNFLLSRRGQAEGFWKVILLILAIATIVAMGVIYYYAAKGSEMQLHNLTRSLRGFR